MKLTGDQLNSQRGRFRTKDLPELAKKTVGAPVLIGHQKQSRPIAKFFDGKVRDFGEQGRFTVNGFFFPSARSDASDLALDLDAGILNEASISFRCTTLTCSECGEDIRTSKCPHFLTEENEVFYFYDGIEDVLEGSIVFRGAHPNTGIVEMNKADRQTELWKPKRTRRFIRAGQTIERSVR